MTAVGLLSVAHPRAAGYAAALADIDGAELAGVADGDDERGRGFAAEHGTAYAGADDLLGRIDAAVVCAATADRESWITTAAEAGVDVLCTAPLAPSTAAIDRAAGACEDAGVRLGVAMPLRFSVPARRARDAVDDGDVGTIRTITGTSRGRLPGGWLLDPDAAGGGAAMDRAGHLVDLVRGIADERVATVHAELATRLHDGPVEDVAVLSMALEDGTPFTLDGSWSRPDGWERPGDATLEIVGADGTIELDCFAQVFTHARDAGDGPGVESVFWGSDPDRGMIADFVAAVEEGRPPAVTPEEGRHAVAVVEAAYASAERGEPVAVDG